MRIVHFAAVTVQFFRCNFSLRLAVLTETIKPKLLLYDLLWICYTTSCTTNPQKIAASKTNPQHLDMSRCCGFVVDSTLYSISTTSAQQIKLVEFGFRQVVDLSWHCSQSQRAVVSRDDYIIIIRHIVKTQ